MLFRSCFLCILMLCYCLCLHFPPLLLLPFSSPVLSFFPLFFLSSYSYLCYNSLLLSSLCRVLLYYFSIYVLSYPHRFPTAFSYSNLFLFLFAHWLLAFLPIFFFLPLFSIISSLLCFLPLLQHSVSPFFFITTYYSFLSFFYLLLTFLSAIFLLYWCFINYCSILGSLVFDSHFILYPLLLAATSCSLSLSPSSRSFCLLLCLFSVFLPFFRPLCFFRSCVPNYSSLLCFDYRFLSSQINIAYLMSLLSFFLITLLFSLSLLFLAYSFLACRISPSFSFILSCCVLDSHF